MLVLLVLVLPGCLVWLLLILRIPKGDFVINDFGASGHEVAGYSHLN